MSPGPEYGRYENGPDQRPAATKECHATPPARALPAAIPQGPQLRDTDHGGQAMLTGANLLAAPRLSISWRRIEWIAVSIALFLQSGAIFPLLVTGAENDMVAADRAILRLVALPVFFITFGLLLRHHKLIVPALLRNWPVVLLLALAFISLGWSIAPGLTLRRAFALSATTFLSYLIALRFTPVQLLRMVAQICGLSVVLSLLLIPVMPSLAYMADENTLRGIYIHKNVLAWMAALAVLCAASIWMIPAAGSRRFAGALMIPSVICLVLTQSATGLLAAIFGIVLLIFYAGLRRQHGLSRLALLLLFLLFAALLLLFLSEFLVPFLEFLGKDATLTGRVPLWRMVDDAIRRSPWLGYGYQAFWAPNSPEAWKVWGTLNWQAPHAHNGFRDTLLSFGVVGLGLLLWLVLKALHQGAALHFRASHQGWIWLNALIGMVLVMNLSETILILPNSLFWVLFCAACLMFSLRHDQPGGSTPSPKGEGPAETAEDPHSLLK
ncbi:O-antigen ligase family protein [Thioclava sp. BHET1]|nr:O-antigen ligase family protein [Thioclava sp. BHET1]